MAMTNDVLFNGILSASMTGLYKSPSGTETLVTSIHMCNITRSDEGHSSEGTQSYYDATIKIKNDIHIKVPLKQRTFFTDKTGYYLLEGETISGSCTDLYTTNGASNAISVYISGIKIT